MAIWAKKLVQAVTQVKTKYITNNVCVTGYKPQLNISQV